MSAAAAVRTLAAGVGFAEGPVLTRAGDVVVTSMSHGCLYRVAASPAAPASPPAPWAVTGGGPNGAAEGADGTLYVAQNGGHVGGRRPDPGLPPSQRTGGVQVVDADGAVAWLTFDPVMPNDLCFGPDGLLYVTDPTRRRDDDSRIWRCDPQTGAADLLLSVPWYANGIAFGREDDALYVASSTDARIVRFALDGDRLRGPEVVVQMAANQPDGFAFDRAGNLTIATFALGGVGDVQTWSAEGELLDVLRPGSSEFYTNVALTSDRRLLVTDGSGEAVLCVDDWPEPGLALHPFRA